MIIKYFVLSKDIEILHLDNDTSSFRTYAIPVAPQQTHKLRLQFCIIDIESIPTAISYNIDYY
jgi:hypothetical protein